MQSVVCLLGSPRANGSSDRLADRFCRASKNAGANVVIHALRDLRYQGYMPPSDSLYESSEDDLDSVLADVEEADVLVLATPIYFCDVTGLMKQALDRFDAFLEEDAETGRLRSSLGQDKTLVLIQVQGNEDTQHRDLLDHYKLAFDTFGFTRQECLRACGIHEPRDLKALPQLFESADTLAEDVLRREFA
ncbi:MAG: NAD(P)H-dependent oxidoreductase [Pseudomonadota bacterium]